jgi:hypothetical protein
MDAGPAHSTGSVRQWRERIIEDLCRHFAEDRLELFEFEERLDAAQVASSVTDLQRLTADLPALGAPTGHPAIPSRHAPDNGMPFHRRFVLAVMSGVDKRGDWSPPRRLRVFAFMGSVELDFRDATLPPGVTEVTVLGAMSGVDVIVPPDLAVECHGLAVMGAFEQQDRSSGARAPGAPLLRVGGFVLMGAVEVQVRLPGETARDAARRRKEQARLQRAEARRLGRVR